MTQTVEHSLVRSILMFGVLLGAPLLLIAEEAPKAETAAIYRPSPVPDRIILTWDDDPATTQAVTWRTDMSVSRAQAEVAEATDGPIFARNARAVPAATELLKTETHQAHYHSVRFSGLKPDTLYCYRVGDGLNWSEWNQFRTAAAGPAPLTFIYFGDSQNDLAQFWSRVIRQAVRTAPDARFMVHAGDLINDTGLDSEWGEWHAAGGWINRSIPSLPTAGNHEYKPHGQLSAHWRPQFTLPDNGFPEFKETNYYLDIQGVRMVSLDTTLSIDLTAPLHAQAEWLEKVLSDNPNRWTILTFHYPMYASQIGKDMKKLRDIWQPIIDKYAVDLVLTGDHHSYARSNLLTGEHPQNPKAGTAYVVSVSGPKLRAMNEKRWWHRGGEDSQFFQVIKVDGDVLSYQSFTSQAILYDAFELRKQKNKPNELINLVPRTPEHRRAPNAGAPWELPE